ncbi:SDR family oxidoreductase [Fulvimarina sp. 2208YS6-2-32]|uniref:SDR family oxidoreductase n=1 Tax=Fulvimarina uroteuthidis TaxID=3098149 RepID=A0ABU5HZT8_9HYPH|nr:SDR family oxidoreductase [Fulvimarina sp. 2208YS6-2-32]MDY8108646.1 SDR family oxidoreductase [Fulvimarina sp. 2208YS6-2-32]
MAKDPRTAYPQPPQPLQRQSLPGETNAMDPKPDHGEESYKGSGKLAGQAAIITGGDSGIGRAVAIAFAREGADVLVSYLDEDEDAEETRNWVEKAGKRCVLMPGDVKDEAHCSAIVERAVSEFGRLDILVNNAAHQKVIDDLEALTAEELDVTFRTNVYSMFFMVKAALKHLKPGATIVNTTSINATDPSAGLLPYAVTKGAIYNFTGGLAHRLIDRGIRVNGVAPGPIWTPFIPATMTDEKIKSFGSSTPIGRAGQPAELAPAYVYLASDDSTYVTGEVIAVTGGRLML